MPAKFSLDYVMKQVDLRKMFEWRIEIDHDWNLKPGAFGKGFKRLLSPDRFHSVERTYVGARIDDDWQALFDTIALFRDVAMEVAEHLGFQYPDQLDANVVAYLHRVREHRTNPPSVNG
jgi:aminoglycoside 6-adenylyltransferase